jgi:hypothetical protein
MQLLFYYFKKLNTHLSQCLRSAASGGACIMRSSNIAISTLASEPVLPCNREEESDCEPGNSPPTLVPQEEPLPLGRELLPLLLCGWRAVMCR